MGGRFQSSDTICPKVARGYHVVIAILATIPMMMGLLTLLYWHLYSLGWIEEQLFFARQHYNSALASTLASLTLFLALRKRRWPALILSFIIISIGALTLLSYHPGSMPPLTAFSFLLLGISLSIISLDLPFPKRQILLRLLGVVIFSMAVIGICGYVIGVEVAPKWAQFTYLDPRPSLELSFLGMLIIVYAWGYCKTYEGALPPSLPIPTTVAVILGTLFLWQSLETQETVVFERATTQIAQNLKNTMETFLKERLSSSFGQKTKADLQIQLSDDGELLIAHLPPLTHTFNLDQVIRGVIPPHFFQDYSFQIEEGDRLLFSNRLRTPLEPEVGDTTILLSFYNKNWTLRLHPREGLLFENRSSLPKFTLVIGCFLAFFVYFSLYFGEAAYIRSKKLSQSEKNLLGSLAQLEEKNRELKEARRASEQANSAKSTFLANMSHEIRTPLNGVIGMASLLQNTELTEKQKRYVERINLSGKCLLEIINDILDFSKIEAGELHLEAIPFKIDTLLKETLELFDDLAKQKSLSLILLLPPTTLRPVLGDPTRLRQVITNLVSNAVKFTERGSVTLQLQLKKQWRNQALFRFEVIDTGIGLSKEQIPSLFEKFSQADASTTRKFGGTGLGLAISKQLVELMGGEIDCISQVGAGTTFWFELLLPFNRAAIVERVAAQNLTVNMHPTFRIFSGRLLHLFDSKYVAKSQLATTDQSSIFQLAYNQKFIETTSEKMRNLGSKEKKNGQN